MKKLITLLLTLLAIGGVAGAQTISLSGIDPKDVQYSGKLGIDTIGIGATPTQLRFMEDDIYVRDIFVIGGQKYIPPVSAKIGLMNYDRTHPPAPAAVPPMSAQFASYINGLPLYVVGK